jgi:hypothetical protein
MCTVGKKNKQHISSRSRARKLRTRFMPATGVGTLYHINLS